MEKWDVYDGRGNITGKIKNENDVFLDDEYHLGASLWIINKNRNLLIQKRAMTKRTNPGKWSITGGAAKAGESSENACVREVFEEIGLKLKTGDIKLLNRIFGKKIVFDDYVIVYDLSLGDLVLQEEEVTEVKWAGIDEIKDLFSKGMFVFDDISELDKVIWKRQFDGACSGEADASIVTTHMMMAAHDLGLEIKNDIDSNTNTDNGIPIDNNIQNMTGDLSIEEKVYGLSIVWKEAEYNFVFWDNLKNLDWDNAYREALPKVINTKDIILQR